MLKKWIAIAAKNTHQLLVLIDQGLVSGGNFISAILLARLLGIESFGWYAFGWMLVLFVSSIQLAFIVSPLFTLFPKHKNQCHYLSGSHSIQLGFSLATFIISFVFVKTVFVYQPTWEIEGVLFSLPLVAALFVLQDFYRRVNFTLKKPLRSLIADAIAYGFQPFAILLLHHFDRLSIHHTFLAISTLFFGAIVYNLPKVKLTFSVLIFKNTITENWSFSKYLVGTALLQWVSGNFFIIVAGGLLGPVAIGAIRIAQNVVGVLHVLFSAMENIIPVKAAEILDQKGGVKAIHYFKKMCFKGGAITLIVLATIALFRHHIIVLFYGEEYLEYGPFLFGFTGLYIFVFIGTILGFVIRTFEMNQIFFWSYIITTVFSLMAAETIIIQTGIYGVLIGLFIVQFINISFYLLKLNSKLKTLWK
jgi:O-antigen/teichoic acid export membrane protein